VADTQTIAELNGISSVEDRTQLQKLQALLDAFTPDSLSPEAFRVLFGVLERFADHDGYGVFWSILHLLEKKQGYESFLLESVSRCPTEFTLAMVNRLLNSGVTEVEGRSLLSVLAATAAAPSASASAQTWARKFLEHQQSRGNNA